jgi:hypothetical protein
VHDGTPFDVSQYADNTVLRDILSDDNDKLYAISEKLWNKSELVKKLSREAKQTEALHAAIDEMRIKGIKIVRNQGKLASPGTI